MTEPGRFKSREEYEAWKTARTSGGANPWAAEADTAAASPQPPASAPLNPRLRPCATCGAQIDIGAPACPHCGRRRHRIGAAVGVGLLVVIGGCMALALVGTSTTPRRQDPSSRQGSFSDDLSLFVARFGPPDQDESSEHERPRPPIVTRWLTYRQEGVQLVYYPDATPGTPPPYSKWKLLGAKDLRAERALSAEELVSRMAHRKRW
jgi:hypothetical protein